MKISNSKKQLAKIISENGGWCDGANIALFGKASGICYLLKTDEWPEYETSVKGFYINARDVVSKFTAAPFANWHQTIISRDEYFHLYPATDADDGWILWNGVECPVAGLSVVDVKYFDVEGFVTGIALDFVWGPKTNIVYYRKTRSESEQAAQEPKQVPVPEVKPTIEQLASDYKAKMEIAQQAQEVADSRRCEAEAALSRLIIACADLGFEIKPKGKLESSGASVIDKLQDKATELAESELNITDWRDLQVGDEVKARCHEGVMVGFVVEMEASDYFGDRPFRFKPDNNSSRWCTSQEFEFIRRP